MPQTYIHVFPLRKKEKKKKKTYIRTCASFNSKI